MQQQQLLLQVRVRLRQHRVWCWIVKGKMLRVVALVKMSAAAGKMMMSFVSLPDAGGTAAAVVDTKARSSSSSSSWTKQPRMRLLLPVLLLLPASMRC
jgi:hypothetical protein